jgi:PleD family two-component response regulator
MVAMAMRPRVPAHQLGTTAVDAAQPPHTALVIDDERPIRRLLKVLLEVQGYQVCEA